MRIMLWAKYCGNLYVLTAGLSDPFVELVMQPEARFEACSDQVFKTHVMKATLDPVFDQEFLL